MKTYTILLILLLTSMVLTRPDIANAQTPNLNIVKIATNSTVNAGEQMSFTIVITNIGLGTANDVTVTDVLPAGFNWSHSGSFAGLTITGGVLTGNMGPLAAGASVTFNVSAPATAAGSVTNTINVTCSNEPSTDLGNNTSSATINITTPDISVSKVAVSPLVNAGDPMQFDITVLNNGPGEAYDVTLTDVLPAGFSWSLISPPAGYSIAAGVLTGNLGTLFPGASQIVSVTALASGSGTVTNTATVSASNESPAEIGNNSSSAEITIVTPDVSVFKSTPTPSVNVGDQVSFTINVLNVGLGTANQVTVNDPLPVGVNWSIANLPVSFTIIGGALTGSIGTLTPGSTFTLNVIGTAVSPGTIVNTVTVASVNEPPSATGNNSSTATVVINSANQCPVARDTAITIHSATTINFQLPASDADGDALTYSIIAAAFHGSIGLNSATGAVVFSLVGGYSGVDQFTFSVDDGTCTDNGIVYFTITNECPDSRDTSVTTPAGTPVNFQLPSSDADGDALNFSIFSPPAHGTVILDVNTGAVTYTPTAGYVGPDQFTYNAVDNVCPDAGTVYIIVTCPEINFELGANRIVYRGYTDSACVVLQPTVISGGPYTYTWSPGGSHATSLRVCPNQTTVYYLTISDAKGCSYVDSVKVCVIDVRCGTNKKSVLICHGTGSASNPYVTVCVDKASAKWHFKNHPGEQLGTCGSNKSCDFETSRMADEWFTIEEGMPQLIALPNPFSSMTSVRFKIPQREHVSVKVYDISGRELAILYNGEVEQEIFYEVGFDGSRFGEGIYFCRMQSASYESTIKLMIVK